jgi:hypothetical protein
MRGVKALMTGSVMVAALTLALPAPAPAQEAKAGVVTTVRGTATVARTTTTEAAPLRFRDDVFVHDRITTGEQSVARILLGGKAVVTVRERSELVITESATTSTLAVSHGKIALAVNKARMRPGESVEIKTPNAVAGIRGTVIIAEVSPGSTPATVASTFTLLTGIVDVTLLDPAGQPSRSKLTLKPMQVVAADGFTALGAPRNISREEAASVMSHYRVNLKEPVPSITAPEVIERQVDEAAERATGAVRAAGAGIENGNVTAAGRLADRKASGRTGVSSAGSLGGTVGGSISAGGSGLTSGGSLVGGTVGSLGGGLTNGGSLVGGTVGSLGGGRLSGDSLRNVLPK